MDTRLLPNNRDELKTLLNDMRTKGATDDELSSAVKEIKMAKPSVDWSAGTSAPAMPSSPIGALKSLAAPFASVAKFEPSAPRVSPFGGGTTRGAGSSVSTANIEEDAKNKYAEVLTQTGNPMIASGEAQKITSPDQKSIAENVYGAAEAGVKQGWQGVKDIGSAITGTSETGAELTPEQRLYKGVGGAFDVIGGGIGTAFSPVSGVIESSSPEVKAVAGAAMKPFEWASAGGEELTDAFTRLVNGGDLTPEQEELIKQGWQLLPQLGAMKYGEYKTRQAKGLAPTAFETVAKPIVEAPIKATVATVKGIGKAASGATDFAVTQATGLTPATRQTIKAGGVAGKSATPEGIQVAKEGALSTVTNRVDQAIREKSAIGKGYEAVRNKQGTVNIGTYLDEKFAEAGLHVKNGKIMATGESLIRNPADIAKLQNIYNMYGRKGNLSYKEFLNLREDVANLVDYTTGTTPGLDIYGKGLRADLNDKFRPQVPGLEATDTKYRPALQILKELKDGMYQRNGELKPGAGDYLANLAGNTLAKKNKLALLEKQVPGITAEVNAINALKNIEAAGATHVGMYFRMITAPAAATVAGGPLAGLAAFIASSPSITVPILQAYGKLKSGVSNVVNSAITKLKTGVGLNAKEATVLKQAIEEPKLNTPKVIEQVRAKVAPTVTPKPVPTAATVKQPSSPLLAEAKKYGTPEEFVKAVQNNSNISQQGKLETIPLNKIKDTDYIELDSALKKGNLSLLEAENMLPDNEINMANSKVSMPIEVIRNSDGTFSLQAGNHRVAQQLINGEKTIFANIQNEKGFSTKDQLTSIWNQAHGKTLPATNNVKTSPLLAEAKKYESAEEFVKAPLTQKKLDILRSPEAEKYEYHLSVEPNLKEGKSFAEQTRTISEAGERGYSAGEGIYSTKQPQYWESQLAYEGAGKTPTELYLVKVKEPAPSLGTTGQQTVSNPKDVVVVKKILSNTSDELLDIGKAEAVRNKEILTSIWNQEHGKTK